MAAGWAEIMDNEEESEFIGSVVLGLGEDRDEELFSRGSRLGKTPNVDRYRYIMHLRMMRDYFSPTPVYGDRSFWLRYRMRHSLFMSILEDVCRRDSYFVQRYDVVGLLGLSPHQKIISALRMLGCGLCSNATNEYCRI